MAKSTIRLVSTLDNPVTISYAGDVIIIPPRGTTKPIDKQQLGAVPKGIIFVNQ